MVLPLVVDLITVACWKDVYVLLELHYPLDSEHPEVLLKTEGIPLCNLLVIDNLVVRQILLFLQKDF